MDYFKVAATTTTEDITTLTINIMINIQYALCITSFKIVDMYNTKINIQLPCYLYLLAPSVMVKIAVCL